MFYLKRKNKQINVKQFTELGLSFKPSCPVCLEVYDISTLYTVFI